MSRSSSIFVICFMVTALPAVLALRCYRCIADCHMREPDVETCYNTTEMKVACSKDAFKFNGEIRVVKECASFPAYLAKRECSYPSRLFLTDTEGTLVSCDSCETDFCNSAPSHIPNILMAAVVLLTFLVTRFL